MGTIANEDIEVIGYCSSRGEQNTGVIMIAADEHGILR
jgi:hypothetical protein